MYFFIHILERILNKKLNFEVETPRELIGNVHVELGS